MITIKCEYKHKGQRKSLCHSNKYEIRTKQYFFIFESTNYDTTNENSKLKKESNIDYICYK